MESVEGLLWTRRNAGLWAMTEWWLRHKIHRVPALSWQTVNTSNKLCPRWGLSGCWGEQVKGMRYFRCIRLSVQKHRSWDTNRAGFTFLCASWSSHTLHHQKFTGWTWTHRTGSAAQVQGHYRRQPSILSHQVFFFFFHFLFSFLLMDSFLPCPCPISSPPWPNPGPVWDPGVAWSLLSCVLPSFITAPYFLALCIGRGSADLKWSTLAAL